MWILSVSVCEFVTASRVKEGQAPARALAGAEASRQREAAQSRLMAVWDRSAPVL
jgi:hypothetical protein